MLIDTMAGVKQAPLSLMRAARSFGASDLHIFRTVLLPAALPFILAGVRIGIGRGIVGLVVGEMIEIGKRCGVTEFGIWVLCAPGQSREEALQLIAGEVVPRVRAALD